MAFWLVLILGIAGGLGAIAAVMDKAIDAAQRRARRRPSDPQSRHAIVLAFPVQR